MFRSSHSSPEMNSAALKPFAFRIREGFLVGLAPDPGVASPCAHCAFEWLRDRNVQVEEVAMEDISPLARKTLTELSRENRPHSFCEVMNNGQTNKLECLVFPHPRCTCSKLQYVSKPNLDGRTNFAFSPIFQLKGVRYGTPKGNLWFFTAIGQTPLTMKITAAHGCDIDREKARFKAVDAWLKQASLKDLAARVNSGESFAAHSSDEEKDVSILSSEKEILEKMGAMGVGNNENEAVENALIQLAQVHTLKQYAQSGKNPMHVVGANTWLRQKLPYFLLQQYDLYPLFYRNSSPVWVVGLAAFSRINTSESPVFVYGAHRNISEALEKALHKILEQCRPMDWRKQQNQRRDKKSDPRKTHLNRWWTHWIYRCPKIALRDVLQLEPHTADKTAWSEFFQKQNLDLKWIETNSALFPPNLRHLVRVQASKRFDEDEPSNVRGIGPWVGLPSGLEV